MQIILSLQKDLNLISIGEDVSDKSCLYDYQQKKKTKPCKGDPVPNPEIAPQKVSGLKGGMYGWTRSGGKKFHGGIDLKNPYGAPVYSMYDGTIYSVKYDADGAGYYTRIQSTINGKTIIVSYFHMQKEGRILRGKSSVKVKAGDIIGYQGDSGNLKTAIKRKTTVSHVHVEVREHDGSKKWGYSHFNRVDPRTYLKTKINDDGTSEKNTDCK